MQYITGGYVIDSEGYRLNVGIILVNHDDKVFWAKRVGREAWQFPQGGMNEHETPEQTLFRELREEIGLNESHVTILGRTRNWLRYRIPHRMIRNTKPLVIGQKQLWFLLRFEAEETELKFDYTPKPEFDHWLWVNYWYPLRQVVSFKKEVYRRAMRELAPFLFKHSICRWGVRPLDNLLD